VRKHAVHHMQSPKSVAAIGGILVILVLFVVLAVLAIFAKLMRARQPIEAMASPDRALGLRPRI
jgi:threonine/homoserine/homoserine lactone efflux protein